MSGRGLVLNVDLNAISENYKTLQSRTSTKIAGVVKADAYGLGADRVIPTLYQSGCRDFFVARIGEALEIKCHAPDCSIYIFDGITSASDLDLCHQHGFIPVLNSLSQIELYKTNPCPATLHIDTGMRRLGLPVDDVQSIIPRDLNLKLILSHAAMADDISSNMTAQQFDLFQSAAAHFPNIPRSFCNSDTALHHPDITCDMIRAGIALYGRRGLQPVVSLNAPILQIRNVKKGETIGYSATYIADTDMRIATVGIGYADGILRSISNAGGVYIKEHKCPIVGRVSMDLITIDISKLDINTNPLDKVEILGRHQTVTDLAEDAKTIPYEVLTTLGKSIEKCYE